MKNGATRPIALSTNGSSNHARSATISEPTRPPTSIPPAAANANVPRPEPQLAAVPIAAASETLYAVSAVASLSRLSPPSSVMI